ncbi:hypothetical protein CLOSTASPAR_05326 [[Clostridium] asparagiforme DSM 15981]|uniref:Uncharacterized protein n=1 Tax=[Clostridium] asparagiforme DSM 15981 TaxID=518636 RepID=C0D7S8_9FIRM|nr:hypothetical protein CLOSTASPAR_05326 [[Clostridium] asparagiforme DSM 15981]
MGHSFELDGIWRFYGSISHRLNSYEYSGFIIPQKTVKVNEKSA